MTESEKSLMLVRHLTYYVPGPEQQDMSSYQIIS